MSLIFAICELYENVGQKAKFWFSNSLLITFSGMSRSAPTVLSLGIRSKDLKSTNVAKTKPWVQNNGEPNNDLMLIIPLYIQPTLQQQYYYFVLKPLVLELKI